MHSGEASASGDAESRDRGLRLFPTSFVGRDDEMSQIDSLIRTRRLVTVTGTGGAGKTRLVHELALRTAASFEDGVVWVDLSRVSDDASVASEVAASCGLSDSPGGLDPAHTVAQHLHANRRLVVLDNCEHVLAGAAEVAETVLELDGPSVLVATSREPLDIAGEVVWRIPSMAVPATADDDEDARRASAVALFLERAASADPSFSPSGDELGHVVAICRRLDGIPLAIELAAARLRSMSLNDIERGLDDRFHVLTAGPRSIGRHRTLHASIDWSHDLLDESTKVAFRRLAVFAGTFTLADAEVLVMGDIIEATDVFALVASLVDKSLVQRIDDRYGMLETMRAYAVERCAESGELDACRARHFDHLCRLAEVWAVDEMLPSSATIAAASTHVADLRATLDWASSLGLEATAGLVAALANSLAADNRFDESNDLVRRALADVPEGSRTWSALVASTMPALSIGGDWWQDGAARALDRNPTAERADEPAAEGAPGDVPIDDRVRRRLRFGLALPELMAGVVGVADELAALVEDAEADGDATLAVAAGLDLAYYCAHNGDLIRSTAALDRAARHRTDSPRAVATARGTSTMIAAYRCDVGTVTDNVTATLESPTHDPRDTMASIIGAMFIGSVPLLQLLHERIRRVEFSGAVGFVPAWLDLNLAVLEGHTAAATRLIDGILGQSFVGPAQAMRMIAADMSIADGDLRGARTHSDEALAMIDGFDCPYVLVMATETAAQLDRLDGEVRRAFDRAHAALDVAHANGLVSAQLNVLENLAVIMAHAGQADDAARLIGACDAFRARTGFAMRVLYLVPMLADLDGSLDRSRRAEGATLALDDAVALARRRRGKRARPPSGWDALTPSELRVVSLVSDGHTNQQVADSLIVSLATVKTHLGHVFQKLGVSNRAQLVSAYRERSSD